MYTPHFIYPFILQWIIPFLLALGNNAILSFFLSFFWKIKSLPEVKAWLYDGEKCLSGSETMGGSHI